MYVQRGAIHIMIEHFIVATCGEFLIFLPHLQLLVVRRCFSPDKKHRFVEEFCRVILSEHLYFGTRSHFLNLCKQTCVRKRSDL